MRAAITVNLSDQARPAPQACGAAEKSDCSAWVTEHVDATLLTLAPESRHIVAFNLSGTTSRAAVLIL